MQCTARSKRSQQQCRNHACHGFTVCRFHGGRSLVGIHNPNFRTGKYSKFLPGRLANDYHAACSDARLLELTHEIALLDARLVDLLKRVDTGEAGQHWRALASAWDDLEEHRSDPAKLAQSFNQVADMIRRGAADWMVWEDIRKGLQERVRLVESERRRSVEMGQMINAKQALVLMGAITEIIRRTVNEYVTDEPARTAVLRTIAREFNALAVGRGGEDAVPAGTANGGG